MLLLLHDMAEYRKPVESLVAKHVREQTLTPVLLQRVFEEHEAGVRATLVPALALADYLMRQNHANTQEFARALYLNCFRFFDNFCRQEVVGALVTHIGSGLAHEVQHALVVMRQLAAELPAEMQPFVIFIKGIFDYVENLKTSHVRLLFGILTKLNSHGGGDILHDDVHILLRKMLSSATPSYKRLGVVASSSVVRALVDQTASRGEFQELAATSAIKLLEMIYDNTHKSPSLLAILCDELAGAVHHGMHPKVDEWISEQLTAEFQELFVVDKEEKPSARHRELPLKLSLPVDNMAQSTDVAIAFVPVIMRRHAEVIHMICPSFKLLQLQTKAQSKGSLTEIDALLFCETWMFEQHVIEDFPGLTTDAKDIVCASLLAGINWLRELLNAFAKQTDAEVRLAVMTRLTQLRAMEQAFASCVRQHAAFVPLPAYADTELPKKAEREIEFAKPAKPAGAKSKGKSKAKTKGKENDGPNESTDSTEADVEDAPEEVRGLDHHMFRFNLRELDLDVFDVSALLPGSTCLLMLLRILIHRDLRSSCSTGSLAMC